MKGGYIHRFWDTVISSIVKAVEFLDVHCGSSWNGENQSNLVYLLIIPSLAVALHEMDSKSNNTI